VTRLREELEGVKEERDILKKAAAYFAKELK
jgi:transposase-like protein